MSWTTPKTWSVGETLTAANFNTHIRDNLNSTQHLLAYKSADENVISSTVLQNDDALLFAMAANDIWHVQVGLFMTGGAATSDARVAFTIPSGSMLLQAFSLNSSNVATMFNWAVSGTATQSIRVTTTGLYLLIAGVVINGGSAGNFVCQWAQQTSTATNLVMEQGSTITGMKLA